MSTEKPSDTGKLAAERLRDMLPEERSRNHPQHRMRGLGGQGRIPRPDEVTPDTVRGRISMPPEVELSLEATDDILRLTGAMATMETEVAARSRTHGPADDLSDAPTAEAPAPAPKHTFTTVDNRNRHYSVNMTIEIPEISRHQANQAATGLILFISACVFATVVFAAGIAMLWNEVANAPP